MGRSAANPRGVRENATSPRDFESDPASISGPAPAVAVSPVYQTARFRRSDRAGYRRGGPYLQIKRSPPIVETWRSTPPSATPACLRADVAQTGAGFSLDR